MKYYLNLILRPSLYSTQGNRFNAKAVLLVYIAISLVGGVISIPLALQDPALIGFDRTFIITILAGAILFSYFVAAAIYLVQIAGSTVLIDSSSPKPSLKEVTRIYILSLVPYMVYSLLLTFIYLLFIPLVYLDGSFYVAYNIFSTLVICTTPIFMIWSYYIIVAAIKSYYKTTTGNAVLSGCLPVLVLYFLIFLCGVMFSVLFTLLLLA